MRTRSYYLINAISMYRLLAAPVLVIILLINEEDIFKWLLALSFFTDMIDGRLARKYKVTSIFGARLDSIADDLTVAAGITGLIILKPQFLKDQLYLIIPLLILFLLQVCSALIRYRKITSFHTYAAKLAALFQGIFLITAFFFDKPPLLLFYAAILITAIDLIEEIILVIILPVWQNDIKGLYWLLRKKDRSSSNSIAVIITLTALLLTSATAPAQHSLPVREIPVLCYHNIRPSMEKHLPDYTISTATFNSQMKMLYDSGYTAILPDQLYNYLLKGDSLPAQSVLISFDDSKEEQYTIAKPILDQYNFKGTFFIMAVTINKNGYMSAMQIKSLSDSGHCIALHTWDHPDMRTLNSMEGWHQQIDIPKKLLEKITGKPMFFFAWPYGAWSQAAINQLILHQVIAAFQLYGKTSPTHPLYTIRRLQVSGAWNAATLMANMRSAFGHN